MATTDFRTFEKKILRGLLSEDKLEQLQENLRDITASDAHKDLLNEVLLNAGRLADYRKTLTLGTASNEELRILRNQLRLSFLNTIDALPDEITVNEDPPLKPKKLMTEQRFKTWVLGIMLVGKLLIMAFIVFQMDTGGFTQEQGLSVIALLLPALTAYLGAIIADIIRRKNDLFPTGNDRKTISSTMKRLTFIVLPLYFLFLFLMINRYAIGYMAQNDGEADFKALMTWLAIIESGFGVYVGQIVYGLFREK
jgi:hypothetical protein